MKIIALDLGSNMALAHNGMDVPIVEHKLFKGPRAHRAGDTQAWIDRRFCQIKDACSVSLVVYERPFARGMDATRSLWGIAGIIEAAATFHGWAVTDATPGDIKKWATGKGDASKEVMTAEAIRRGYVGNNEHEADAFLLLKFAEANALVLK